MASWQPPWLSLPWTGLFTLLHRIDSKLDTILSKNSEDITELRMALKRSTDALSESVDKNKKENP